MPQLRHSGLRREQPHQCRLLLQVLLLLRCQVRLLLRRQPQLLPRQLRGLLLQLLLVLPLLQLHRLVLRHLSCCSSLGLVLLLPRVLNCITADQTIEPILRLAKVHRSFHRHLLALLFRR